MSSPGGPFPRHNLILAAWIGLIFFCSTGVAGRWADAVYAALFSTHGPEGGFSMVLLQKGVHVFLFAVLGWLLASAVSSRLPALYRAVLWSFLIGALSEVLQFGFEGRGPALADVLLNGVSGSAGGWIWLRLLAARQKAAPGAVS